MRALVLLAVAALLAAPPAALADSDDDDPHAVRPSPPRSEPAAAPVAVAAPREHTQTEDTLVHDEDDPKLAFTPDRGAPVAASAPAGPEHPTPFIKLGYRRLGLAPLIGKSNSDVDAFDLDLYPLSLKWIRLGIDLEVGVGGGTVPLGYATSGLSVGFQYPWRVTPFVDFRFVTGIVGGSFSFDYMNVNMSHTVASWIWIAGLDVGFELYLVDRMYLSAAIGWAHPVYHAVDVEYLMAHPLQDPVGKDFAADVFTFKLGIGL